MILNNQYNFIFLKQRRTSSTTLEILLSAICSADDIISKNNSVNDVSREQFDAKAPQNNLDPTKPYSYGLYLDINLKECIWHNTKQLAKFIPFSQRVFNYSERPSFNGLKFKEENQRYFGHVPAETIKKHIGDETFDRIFKFTVVRNPFDQILSWYFWLQATGGKQFRMSFKPFVSLKAEEFFESNKRVFMIDEKSVANDVLYYEHLVEDFIRVGKKLNLPEGTINLYDKIATNNWTRKTRGYDLIDPESRDLIIEKGSYFFTEFGYSRDLPTP